MRITLVSPYDLGVPGGVQSHVLDLAAALRGVGDRVQVIAPGSGPHTGVGRSTPIPANGSLAPVAPYLAAARRTAAALHRFRPDVVHVHEPLVPCLGPAAVLRAAPAPVVATFHAATASPTVMRVLRPLGRLLLRHLDDLIAVSGAAAVTHAAALGVPASRFHLVPNGVDVARFAHARAPAPPDDVATVLFVGRLEPRKGLDVLIRAFAEVRRTRPRTRLVVVGDGPEHTRCRDLLDPADAEYVRFAGRAGAGELPGHFAAADVFVAPARGGESFGIVLLEAMAAGTPVVASAIDGYRGVVRDGVDGVLTPPGDPAALAAAIVDLLADRHRAAGLAAAGRRRAGEFDWSVIATQLRSRYQRLLEA